MTAPARTATGRRAPAPHWRFRPASAADAEAVAELRAVVLRADLERLGRYDEQRVRQRLRDGFTPAHTWVIEVNGAFAGCVALRPAGEIRLLEHFYVAPRLQGGGIGSAVLRTLLARCDRDALPVRLNVLRGSPARRLYERHGFALESEDAVDVFMVRPPRPWPAPVPPAASADTGPVAGRGDDTA
ncbi:GNAT family N-acetyltransferase [Streptomyces ziwulingensis]|uniref:GNAT family N-acetyltransferase n=1 Tax=Streptomyces ziwulingensis TaxID=1045501 RepID=UPI0031EB755D